MQDPSGSSNSRRSLQWRVQLAILSPRSEEWPTQLSAQRSLYAQWVQEYPFVQETDPKEQEAVIPSRQNQSQNELDPLTAMYLKDHEQTTRLQQLDLKYRKEKALRKRSGVASSGRQMEDESLTQQEERALFLQIIDKDLNRLPDPDQVHGTSVCTDFRREILRQVLYIFACRHAPEPGYQQGMHEIASYLLYALELDGCGAPVAAASADTYHMLETVLEQIQPAFDVTADPATNKSPLEQMSIRILQVVAQHDAHLHQKIMGLGVPPQLIFTKWIRLLYSREVTNVLQLWDVMFACHENVQAVAESLAATRLLFHRNLLMEQEHDLLQLLMNMPVEENIQPLVAVLNALLAGNPPPLPAPVQRPPLPSSSVSQAAMAAASSWTDPLSQAFGNMTTSLSTNANFVQSPLEDAQRDGNRFSLNTVKDRLASKTQFIGKRLIQEWEQIASNNNNNSHQQQSPSNERNYDDPPPDPLRSLSQQSYTVADVPSTRNSFPPSPTLDLPASVSPRQLAIQLNGSIGILQSFAVQRREQVPEKVWEALANLEVIRQNLVAMDRHGSP